MTMSGPLVEDLVHLPEEEALRRRLDGSNWEWLKFTAAGVGAVAFIALLAYLFASDWLRLIAPIAAIAIARSLFIADDDGRLRGFGPPIVILFDLLLWGLVIAIAPSPSLGLQVVGVLAPLAALGFRLPTLWAAILLLSILVGTLLPSFLMGDLDDSSLLGPRVAIQAGLTLVGLYFLAVSTQKVRQTFLRSLRVETSRVRERQRMREELASARHIQLSMLPRHDPKVPGLDISAASLPAAEVGGDYYEYFDQETDRFAVVVGDVAGHGVASGLLLSGIRSCLYLLHPERPSPKVLFEKLDRMVRQTTARRMFITLLYVVFDRPAQQLVLSSAGHPPALLYRRQEGTVEEISLFAPPLGTRLRTTYEERKVDYKEGDVLLLYTDGLIEAVNKANDAYGEERLRRRFERSAKATNARSIRETLLSDVWNFKGDAEQLDDITVMVIRIV